MKIYVVCYGDRSVGIPDATITINLPCFDEDDRETLRSIARELALGERAYVLFDDECSDCGARLDEQRVCTRSNCVSKLPEFDD